MGDDSEFEGYVDGWLSRQMSRRQFLGGVGGVSAGVVIGSSLPGVALRRGTRATLLGKKVSAAWAKAPVSFVFLDTTEPNTLDPSMESEFDGMLITQNTYDALTWANEATGALEPRLATSWKTNSDGTQQVFQIRPGVKFIDGSPLNAAAVALAMRRHIAVGAPSQAGYMLAGITSVEATGAMEVTFTTSAPQPWLADHMVMFPIMSSKAIEAHKTSLDPWAKAYFADHVDGTGPYKLESWVHGTKITLTKNEAWWNGPWKHGSLDRITVQWESDPGTSAELIESGTANFSTEWSIDNALTVSKLSGFSLHRYKAYNTDPMVCFNQGKPPFQIKEVRQAFQYAFDYDAMRKYFRGYAVPTTGVFPPFNPYALKGLPEYKQDLSRAKALLAQAGVAPSSLTPTCYSSGGYPDLIAGGTILQSSLAKIGVNIKLETIPFSSLESAVTSLSTSPPVTSALYNGIFSYDPTSFLSSFLPSSFGNAFMRYKSPALVAAYKQASSSSKASEVREGLNKAQKIIHEDAPALFGAIPELLIPVPDYLEGYVMQRSDDEYPCQFALLRVHEH